VARNSYTLRETAELLGVERRVLQRRLQEGAFPYRFLAPGEDGLEIHIPAEDVDAVIEQMQSTPRPRALPSPAPMLAVAPPSSALAPASAPVLQGIKRALVEGREEVRGLRDEIAQLRKAVERLTLSLPQTPPERQTPVKAEAAQPIGALPLSAGTVRWASSDDLDQLLSELGDLERLVASNRVPACD
jgi:hypothetical protein